MQLDDDVVETLTAAERGLVLLWYSVSDTVMNWQDVYMILTERWLDAFLAGDYSAMRTWLDGREQALYRLVTLHDAQRAAGVY